MFTYNTGIPAANNNPSDDQPLMQTNTDSINSWTLIDHRGFGDVDTFGGYHTNVHLVSQGAAPAAIPAGLTPLAVGQLLDLSVTTDSTTPDTDTQLFHVTSNGGISQLTGNAAQEQGYQWIGGTLIQWGTILLSTGGAGDNHRTASILFQGRLTTGAVATTNTIPFPNNCFSIQLTFAAALTSLTTNSSSLYVQAISPTGFTWVANSSSSSFATTMVKFYWIAIGN